MKAGEKNKIAIIGPYPLPYGGISVHIERILNYLPKNSYDFYNISLHSEKGRRFVGLRKYFYLFVLLLKPYKVIHYHSTSLKVRLLLSMISRIKKNVYLHLHGESFIDQINKSNFTTHLLKRNIKSTNLIASNNDLLDIVKDLKPLSVYLCDAFIPPKFDINVVNRFSKNYVLTKYKHVVSMVGWFSLNKSEDLYGFDIALKALFEIRTKYKTDMTFVASVNGINNNELYNSFINERQQLNLESNFILIEENLEELYPLILSSHLFIRPTNTDGNSVSIKEALWYSTPVVASDCVIRPSETILFKNRDAKDLADKIMKVIFDNKLLTSVEKIDICEHRTFNYPLIKDIYGLEQ